ncbi:MAG: FtsK/SpoIIIE domain-containing protein, partial [Chloroflexota bacterium]
RHRVGPMAMRKIFNTGTVSAIQAAARVDSVNVWQVRDAIIYQYQLDKSLWKYYQRADLPSPAGIGLGVGRCLVPFSLDNKNTLVAGETRSGKSVTIESILFALMATYPRDDMGLVVIDPNRTLGIRKDGLRALEVGNFTNVVHLLRPVASSVHQVEDAINYVYVQWQQRMRNGTRGEDAPAIVLIVDELMSEAVIGDKEAGQHNEAHLAKLSQLASQGIKNNIFLVLGAQDPKIGNTSGLLMRNLGLRYIGHVTDENASRMLVGRGGVNAHRLTGNGDFVQVVEDTLVRFQVAEPARRDFERLERQPVAAEPVGPVDIIDVPVPQEEPAPEFDLGRLLAAGDEINPTAEPCVDARTLAIYFYEKKLSIAQAKEKYGLGRVIHSRHRDFALDLLDELKHLAAGRPSRSPYVKLLAGQEVTL